MSASSSRVSIREPQGVARLSHTFSQSLSAVDLAEPLLSADENQPVAFAAEILRTRNVKLLGVRRAGLVTGWVGAEDLKSETLGECAREFSPGELLEASAGVAAVLGSLQAGDHVFVEWLGEVTGVITRDDLQKAPLRMWLFGAITVFDSNLTWAIDALYPGDTWQGAISPGRFEKAVALRAERQRRGAECRLVDCLQVKDKADILVRDAESVAVLGLKSRREADRLTSDIEGLRNHLAHAQELEAVHLATASRLASYIDSILSGDVARRIVAAQRISAPGRPCAQA